MSEAAASGDDGSEGPWFPNILSPYDKSIPQSWLPQDQLNKVLLPICPYERERCPANHPVLQLLDFTPQSTHGQMNSRVLTTCSKMNSYVPTRKNMRQSPDSAGTFFILRSYGFSDGKNIKFYFRKKHRMRKNSSVS
jgi:hypothetical protein